MKLLEAEEAALRELEQKEAAGAGSAEDRKRLSALKVARLHGLSALKQNRATLTPAQIEELHTLQLWRLEVLEKQYDEHKHLSAEEVAELNELEPIEEARMKKYEADEKQLTKEKAAELLALRTAYVIRMQRKIKLASVEGPPALTEQQEVEYIRILVIFLSYGVREKGLACDALHQLVTRRSQRSSALRQLVVAGGAVEPLYCVLRNIALCSPKMLGSEGGKDLNKSYFESCDARPLRSKAAQCLYAIAAGGEHKKETPVRDQIMELAGVTAKDIAAAHGQVFSALWAMLLKHAGFTGTEREVVPQLIEVSDCERLPGLEPEKVWLADKGVRPGRRERWEAKNKR